MRGRVSLVGAGPGDPGLLTLAGADRIRAADVVYFDALVAPEILLHARPEARLVSVGKRRGRRLLSQDQIIDLLVRDAHAGLHVVRLKGGDPFVFGRGGEEALALSRAGVPFEIVPGVTSGIAVPARAGIPLTHRGLSSSAAFVTAHDVADPEVAERMRHLALGGDTLVVFMAGTQLVRLRKALLDAGVPAERPVAVIESGTLPEQRVFRGVLRDPDLFANRNWRGPVLLVIGNTVSLADELARNTRAEREERCRTLSA